MNTALILQHGLLYGAILSTLMTVLILGSLRLNPEMWLNDYPPDVRAKWGPMSAKARRQQLLVALPTFTIVIGLTVVQLIHLAQRAGGDFSFWGAALSLWLSLMLFNLVDLVVIDWFFIVFLRPRFIILPGTEGLAGYSDYSFAFNGFLKGTVGITLASALLAAIANGVYVLLR